MTALPTISVCIPAYGRVREFTPLLDSLLAQHQMPLEILICEDGSAEREELRTIAKGYTSSFEKKNCVLRFEENPVNLGYDGNIRRLIALARADYVFFIGNDDYILPTGIHTAQQYVAKNLVLAASRSFGRFDKDPLSPIGYSRVFKQDTLLSKESYTAGWVLRIGGFFGGLMFQRQWAANLATDRYDGTLYYQIYLLLHAYAQGMIGYMATPTVAARAGNTPLFGSASAEKDAFTPGRYTAEARGKMWESILKITQDVEQEKKVKMLDAMRQELGNRMSFHVFEMFAGRPTRELKALRDELQRLQLFDHVLPRFLYWHNRLLKTYAPLSYMLARRVLQR
jgi:abequosyltransferase